MAGKKALPKALRSKMYDGVKPPKKAGGSKKYK